MLGSRFRNLTLCGSEFWLNHTLCGSNFHVERPFSGAIFVRIPFAGAIFGEKYPLWEWFFEKIYPIWECFAEKIYPLWETFAWNIYPLGEAFCWKSHPFDILAYVRFSYGSAPPPGCQWLIRMWQGLERTFSCLMTSLCIAIRSVPIPVMWPFFREHSTTCTCMYMGHGPMVWCSPLKKVTWQTRKQTKFWRH